MVTARWLRGAIALLAALVALGAVAARAAEADPLAVGVAGHAFDHFSEFNDQADAAVASGANIIYSTGVGSLGYVGLPAPEQLKDVAVKTSAYLRHAKTRGVRLAIGYVCATSIVKLETFDKNWPEELRSRLSSPPAQWLQRDRDGKPLPSWYGGDYRPACMNNPDWRTYEKFIVRQQLEAGHDGIFFDNPTVHPQGCYCDHCMTRFARFLAVEGAKDIPAPDATAALRQAAIRRPSDFLRFRSTIARDFLGDVRQYARTINPHALITCNNSLNSPDVLFAQSRSMGYNIYELSKAEDFVVIEDMGSLSRTLSSGAAIEYGPMYEVLRGIAHGKPVVAVTIAEGDYHTAPNLTRLAMAEAAAHGASYLGWPTWPQDVRKSMSAAIRPEADVLRQNAALLNDRERRADALVFLPFRRWVDTADCQPVRTALALGAANMQFAVVCEDDLGKRLAEHAPPALIIESSAVLLPAEKQAVAAYKASGGHVITTDGAQWVQELAKVVQPSAVVKGGPPTVRVTVHDQVNRTIVHLLNLNVQRLSSFQDTVTPAENVRVRIRVPFGKVASVNAITADVASTRAAVEFTSTPDADGSWVDVKIAHLDISTILSIE